MNAEQLLFDTVTFCQPRKQVVPSNPLQVLIRKANELLKDFHLLENLNICWDDLKILPEKEQTILLGLLRGEEQKSLAKRLHRTQGAISSRASKAVRRLMFYKRFPQVTEKDYRLLGKHFSELEVEIIRGMLTTSCQCKTAVQIQEKFGIPFTQVKVRHRWKKALATVQSIPELGKVALAMQLIDHNLYIFHEVKWGRRLQR